MSIDSRVIAMGASPGSGGRPARRRYRAGRGRRTPPRPDGSRELGAGTLKELAVDGEVGPLVVEADQPRDLLALGQRGPVRPGDVVDDPVRGHRRPVLREALVRAPRG